MCIFCPKRTKNLISSFVFRYLLLLLHSDCGKMRQIVLVIGFVALAIVLLGVGIFLRKDHSFRSQHIAQNKRMQQDGIHCATSQDRELRRTNKRKINIKNL